MLRSLRNILVLLLAAPAVFAGAQSDTAVARTIVTVLGAQADVPQQAVSVQVNGSPARIVDWHALRNEDAGLQLLVLIDDAARTGISLQYPDLKSFIQSLPASTQVGVAYMQNGTARFAQDFTTNKEQAASGLRLPNGNPGSNGSPYFVLTDLLKHWPNPEHSGPAGQRAISKRRAVLMLTNGVEAYESGQFDPQNVYVQRAIDDCIRGNVLVYAIYVRDRGTAGQSLAEADNGQNYLAMLTDATGGNLYYTGTQTSPNFRPYFDNLKQRLSNQYELSFVSGQRNRNDVTGIKVRAQGVKITAPQRALVGAK